MKRDETPVAAWLELLGGGIPKMPGWRPMAPQLAPFWQAQEGILDEAEALSARWFGRRHEGAQSAIELARKMNVEDSGAFDAMSGMREWQAGAVNRMADDWTDWSEFCARCAGLIARPETAKPEPPKKPAPARKRAAKPKAAAA